MRAPHAILQTLQRRGRPMFEVGKSYTIRMFDQDGGTASYRGCKVIAYERPVVKFQHAGEEWIVNTHSWAFFDARPEN